jgi:ABC-type transporter Mla subunit MlaD
MLTISLMALTPALMGIALPSCPGQEEANQKVEAIQKTTDSLSKTIQGLKQQIDTLNTDMAQAKQLMPQMANVIQAQKEALDKLDVAVKELQARVSAPASKKKK